MFDVSDIASAVNGRITGPAEGSVCSVSTDSRTVRQGELFVPLKGERFDGHDYIPQVLANGVTVFLASAEWAAKSAVPETATCIVVDDTLKAMGDLAKAFRTRFDLPVAIGVTGSNGKTTTKEMLASILSLTGQGLKTLGNLNNLIGLPQMIFKLSPEHRWLVLEMGMSEPGEIDRLAEIAAPRVGIITNAFPAHLASMGSVEAVAEAKGELFLRLPPGGVAVANADDPRVSRLPVAAGVRRVTYGIESGEVRASDIRSLGVNGQQFTLHLFGRTLQITLSACGRHNVLNALAAATAASVSGVPAEMVEDGLTAFRPYDKRFNTEEINGMVLIDDSYNANPASVEAALRTLEEIKGEGRAFAVFGDMLELGEGEAEDHRGVGRLAASFVERLYLLGDLSRRHTAEGALEAGMSPERVVRAVDHGEIVVDLLQRLEPGDLVLIKGSRGMRMETVTEGLRNGLVTKDEEKG